VKPASCAILQGKARVRLAFLPTSRRKFIRLTAAAGVAALAADSTLLEPNFPRLVRQEISLRRWPSRLDGFTIALLSDFHYDPYFSVHPLKAAIPMVNRLRPDLIVLTGDFVTFPVLGNNPAAAADAAVPCARLLRQMEAPQGLWAIMGNHDFFTDPVRVGTALRAQGIRVLANESVAIESNGARFWLAGVNDVLSDTADLDATLRDVQGDEATVLLAHEPDYADLVARSANIHPVDLQLSGHTHGGQLRVPFLPPLYLPDLGKKYVAGLFKIGPLTLYTNAGLGTVGVPARFNCPPEITFLTMRRAAS
jgi:predicted MPP superfamily phosphohydrolase